MTIVEFSYYRFIFANHTMIVEVTNAFGISLTLIKWPKNGWGNGIKMSKNKLLTWFVDAAFDFFLESR